MWKDKDYIEQVVKSSYTKSEILRKLDLKIFTGNYDTLNRYIKKYELDISHFKLNLKNTHSNRRIPLNKIMVENSTYNRTHLKRRLYREGLKERICELCGQDEMWKETKISLILDHINGVNDDHREENLRIVCPNCNAGLPTHCGKNLKIEKKEKKKKEKVFHYCKDCGDILSRKSKSGLCISCYNKQYNYKRSIKQRKVERPSYETLLKELKESNYSAVGRKYGVSDNSIRKWIKYYEKHN